MTAPLYHVGSLTLAIVSDGVIWRDAGAIFGLVPKVLWERVSGPLNDRNELPLGLNCLLLRSEGKTILIETGQGDKDFETLRRRGAEPQHGRLLDDLAANGVQPEDVEIVINTHLHNDHCGWNTRTLAGELRPTFPRARYYLQRSEWEEALQPNERTRAAYLTENLRPLAETGQVELIEGETRVTADVTVIESPGHTAGHASVVISNGGESAVYLGDLTHHAAQLERLAWISAYDVLPLATLETKRTMVQQALQRNQLLICVHHPFPGVARLRLEEGKTRYLPEAPQPPRGAP